MNYSQKTYYNISITIILIFILYKSPFQHISYHDEIINLWKGSTFHIFDYSLRPLSFLINSIAIRFLGNHPSSLIFLSLFSVLFSCLVMMKTVKLRNNSEMFFFTASMLGCTIIFTTGVAGMINTLLMGYVCLIMYLYQKISRHSFAIGCVTGLGLGLHPTYIFAMPTLFLLFFIRNRKDKNEIFRYILGIVTAISIFEVTYLLFKDSSYLGLFFHANKKISSIQKYEQPASYYFEIALRNLAAPIIVIIYGKIRNRRLDIAASYENFVKTMGFILVLIFITMVSWKFERVLLSFIPLGLIPLLELSMVELKQFNRFEKSISYLLFSCFVVLSAFNIHSHRKSLEKNKFKYTAPYNYVTSFDIKKVTQFILARPKLKENHSRERLNYYAKGFLYFPNATFIETRVSDETKIQWPTTGNFSDAIIITNELVNRFKDLEGFRLINFKLFYRNRDVHVFINPRIQNHSSWGRDSSE